LRLEDDEFNERWMRLTIMKPIANGCYAVTTGELAGLSNGVRIDCKLMGTAPGESNIQTRRRLPAQVARAGVENEQGASPRVNRARTNH